MLKYFSEIFQFIKQSGGEANTLLSCPLVYLLNNQNQVHVNSEIYQRNVYLSFEVHIKGVESTNFLFFPSVSIQKFAYRQM